MYRIGIIDDKVSERADIQVSILDNVGVDSGTEFKEYELTSRSKDDIFKEILEDVNNEMIQALVVDFRLDTTADVIKGWEIIAFMHENIPEFPVIIMTNAPDESKESAYTDADKVYAKKIFLDPSLEQTKELVKNIMYNMEKYVLRRKSLEANLVLQLNKLDNDSSNELILREVMKIESELSDFKNMDQTMIDTVFEVDDLKSALEELKKYEELLG